MECPGPCILRVQNPVYCWPGGACWAAGQSGAQGPVMCGAGLTGGVGAVGLVARSGRAGRLGRHHRARWLPGLGWAAVAARAVALIWEFARMDFLTIRGELFLLPYRIGRQPVLQPRSLITRSATQLFSARLYYCDRHGRMPLADLTRYRSRGSTWFPSTL